jgi:hypothetical protein
MKRIVNALRKLNLPESILKHLNMYAIAASGAWNGRTGLGSTCRGKD